MRKFSQYTKATMRPTQATTVLFRYFPSLTGFLKKLCTTDWNHTSKIMNFYKAQYGFRESFSTQHAILDIVSMIQTNMDKKMFTCGIFSTLRRCLIRSITVFYLINWTIMELEVLHSSGLRRTWPIEHKFHFFISFIYSSSP